VKIRSKNYPQIGAATVFVVIVVSISGADLIIAIQSLKAASPARISMTR
jgi:hypothetical protein